MISAIGFYAMSLNVRSLNFNIPAIKFLLKLFIFSLAFTLCLSANAQTPDSPQISSTPERRGNIFNVQGSNTVGASLMKNLLIDFFQMHSAIDLESVALPTVNEYRVQAYIGGEKLYVNVAAHGSSTGFRGLLNQSTDIAMSSRRIRDNEAEQLNAYGNLRGVSGEHIIAIDGLAIIVNRDNPVQTLSLQQIAEIFSGKIRNWKQVGGYDANINIYARDENSGTWDTFSSLVLGKQYPLYSTARRFESNDNLSDTVAGDISGIGFVGLASVRKTKAIAVSESGAQAFTPEPLVVATEDYALSRRLYLYTPTRTANDWIRHFIRYVQTDRAQRVVEKTGFVAQTVLSVTPTFSLVEGENSGDYTSVLHGAERLSTNIRFAEGSAELDNKAQHDINRIVKYMSRPENEGRRIVLLGFSDRMRQERSAEILSQLRAIAVKGALLKKGIYSERVHGFGTSKPVADNSGASRARNRRVEVWVR